MMGTNLLPASEKKALQAEKNLRLTTIGSVLGILAVIIVGGFTWGLQQIVALNKTSLDQQLATLQNQQRTSEAGQVNAQIEEFNKLLTFFDGAFNNQPVWTPILEKLISLTPTGMTWGEVTGSTKDTLVEIKGTAATREVLLQALDAFKAEPQIDSVDSPLSNIVVRENIPFTITLKLKANSLFPYRNAAK